MNFKKSYLIALAAILIVIVVIIGVIYISLPSKTVTTTQKFKLPQKFYGASGVAIIDPAFSSVYSNNTSWANLGLYNHTQNSTVLSINVPNNWIPRNSTAESVYTIVNTLNSTVKLNFSMVDVPSVVQLAYYMVSNDSNISQISHAAAQWESLYRYSNNETTYRLLNGTIGGYNQYSVPTIPNTSWGGVINLNGVLFTGILNVPPYMTVVVSIAKLGALPSPDFAPVSYGTASISLL